MQNKSRTTTSRRHRPTTWARTHAPTARRGSTLLIVMVLMGMLALLGVMFYTFSAQERSNAEYYSEAAKEQGEPRLDEDVLFDFALEQIIVGTNPQFKNSMLWGSRHSLLSNALGFGLHKPGDLHPFNGEGVNVIFDDSSGNVAVDQNRNGKPDDGTSNEPDNRFLLSYNDSPAAQNEDANRNGTLELGEDLNFNGVLDVLIEKALTQKGEDLNGNDVLDTDEDVNGNRKLDYPYPQSDVGYTYPDINNAFLCYVGKVRDQNGNVHQVVKPSYLLPGILRNAGRAPNTNWCQDPTTVARSMRAHPNHLFVPANPSQGATVNRYLTTAEATALIGPTGYGFPFTPMDDNYKTAPAKNPTGAAYLTGKMGVYSKLSATPNGDDRVEFDYDNDGDGVRDSILMDLGHCVRSDASGKKYVPLFLITIHDLDSLVNLNAHGNLAKILYGPNDLTAATTPVRNTANPFGTDGTGNFDFISRSNLGLGPSEVNPLWALNARYNIDGSGTVFTQHQAFFGTTPTLLGGANPPWGETANMELLWAKIGRPQYSGATIQDLYPGVYGEEGRLYQAVVGGSLAATGGQTLPRPGSSLLDDNFDVSEGQGQAASPTNPFPSFQHPLDYSGLGSYLSSTSPKQLNWSTSGANRWIAYSQYGNNSTTLASSNVKWGQKAGLMNNSLTQGLGDDAQEVALYADDKRDIDNPFKPDEMLYLQLSKYEIKRLNVSSRLSKLLPFNFAKDDTFANGNLRGEFIRKKFTTLSNDRKSFGLPSVANSASYGRAWEFSLDPTSKKYTFPPQFGSIARFATTANAEDPFRQAVRYLLEIEKDGTQPTTPRLQRKLSLNQLLTGASSNQLAFRDLTPHPEDPGAATISPTTDAAYPPTTAAGQEYWARRDRQQMARDIYVLLYLLGHGDDKMDTANHLDLTTPSSPSPKTPYDAPKPREMAQFAVNLVDALDRDNMITRFEYDKDLSDGWNLDDNAYSYASESTPPNPPTDIDYPNDTDTRGEVFGVERLDLTISEVLAIKALKASSQADSTTWGDIDQDQHFVYVELRNHGPFDITFDNKEAWKVVMKQAVDPSAMPPITAGWERRLTLKSGSIASGAAPYVIGSTDTNDPSYTVTGVLKKSTFGVDPAGMGFTHDKIAPNGKECDLDLIETTPASNFRIEDENDNDLTKPSDPPGAFLSAFTGVMPKGSTNSKVQFELWRRSHLTRQIGSTTVEKADNPWVKVDSFTLPKGDFRQLDVSSSTSIADQLKLIKSKERPQPLDGANPADNNNGTTAANSLGADNSNIVTPFDIWQPHFDRDFASVMDLLYLPIFGPDKITTSTKDIKKTSATGTSAAARFLNPGDTTNSNRWHRLLEFLEVPTRTNRNLGIVTDLSIPRVPGRMNLNTFRFADNFAALLDDSRNVSLDLAGTVAGRTGSQIDPEAGELFDKFESTPTDRDWWGQFLKSRDPIDPYWKSPPATIPPTPPVEVALPGLPGSKPFRSLAHLSSTTSTSSTKTNSIEDTILRSLPADSSATDRRGLFEIGTATEHSSGTVDPFIRHRLLAKIAGNTTTRSNSFAVFISVKYFQAVEDKTTNPAVPAVRIGGPLNGILDPEHRGFFIVDRSKLEKGQTSGGTRFDFRDFVEYRKTLK